MPNIWMDVDAALAEVPVNALALIDSGDFITREESVTFDQAGMDLVWNFTNTAGDTSQTVVTPTTGGGEHDWTNLGNGMYAIAIPASGGDDIDNDTEGFGWFSGFATGILPWSGPVVGFRDGALNDLLIDDALSATRGLAGTALPAAAADAAGGLVVSDAGGLDIDTLLGTLTTLAAEPRSANVLGQLKTIIAVIESQRAGHTHQPGTGAILFIDAVNGDTHANGNRGGISDPYATYGDAETNAGTDFGHDLYIFVAGSTGGVSTHTETITVNNGYSSLRGPGRGQILTSSGAVKTINIVADGCEVKGFQITSDVTTGQDAIDITDADFAVIHSNWILDTRGDGVHLLRATNCFIALNHFAGTGTLGSGQGIHIVGTSGSSNDNVIHNNHFANTSGTAILVQSGATTDTEIHHNTIHNAGGWGVDLQGSSTDAQVHSNVFGNNASGNINDGGTTTIIANNEQWAKNTDVVYMSKAIWIDTVNGVAGTVPGTNGTRSNPVDSLADAVTLAASQGTREYRLLGASSIELISAHSNWTFIGQNGATVTLGGVNISGSHFECLRLTGDADGNDITARFCSLQSLINLIGKFEFCQLIDNATLAAGDHYWFHCASAVAGTATPYIDIDGDDSNARNLHMRLYSGGLEIRTHTSTDATSFDCPVGQLVIAASCTGGTIAARGNIVITDNASGAVTVSEDAVVNIPKINIVADTALSDYNGPTNAELEARTLLAASYATSAALAAVAADLPNLPTKNVALANFPFVMVLSSDHVTGATGLTVVCQRSIDGGAYLNCTNTPATEVANGSYEISLSAADMNGDTIMLKFTAATADARFIGITTQPT